MDILTSSLRFFSCVRFCVSTCAEKNVKEWTNGMLLAPSSMPFVWQRRAHKQTRLRSLNTIDRCQQKRPHEESSSMTLFIQWTSHVVQVHAGIDIYFYKWWLPVEHMREKKRRSKNESWMIRAGYRSVVMKVWVWHWVFRMFSENMISIRISLVFHD